MGDIPVDIILPCPRILSLSTSKIINQLRRNYTQICVKYIYWKYSSMPAKPLHNSDTVSVHFNHFYCMEICDKLRRDLAMLTYIYLNVDECWLASSTPQHRLKLQSSLNYANIEQNSFSWPIVNGHVSFKMVGVHITLLLP